MSGRLHDSITKFLDSLLELAHELSHILICIAIRSTFIAFPRRGHHSYFRFYRILFYHGLLPAKLGICFRLLRFLVIFCWAVYCLLSWVWMADLDGLHGVGSDACCLFTCLTMMNL
jgi:hypothetical protein